MARTMLPHFRAANYGDGLRECTVAVTDQTAMSKRSAASAEPGRTVSAFERIVPVLFGLSGLGFVYLMGAIEPTATAVPPAVGAIRSPPRPRLTNRCPTAAGKPAPPTRSGNVPIAVKEKNTSLNRDTSFDDAGDHFIRSTRNQKILDQRANPGLTGTARQPAAHRGGAKPSRHDRFGAIGPKTLRPASDP